MNAVNATRDIAVAIAGLDPAALPADVRDALTRSLLDSLAVGIAGSRTPEHRVLVRDWPLPDGPARLWGTDRTTDVATATLLNGTALCSLELDEGNKFARGHPGAHVLPAVLAEAQRLGADGRAVQTAYLAGYEVAARFARAFEPAPGLHPHGNWGALGAAAAVARLGGLDADGIAAAIDAAAALVLATPFSSALDGSFVRNTWVGAAGNHGITAARIAAAGLGSLDGTVDRTLGALLGRLDVDAVTSDLGERFEIVGGYFKRHSSCNYTHPPADAAIELWARGVRLEDVERVTVTTHRLALPLERTAPRTRLAAMFSIPHVVAVAFRDGCVRPEAFTAEALADPGLARVRNAVVVAGDPAIDARLPGERVARVEVALRDGRTLSAEVPNAIGDAAHHPFGLEEITAKAVDLLGEAADPLVDAVARLDEPDGLASLDRALAAHLADTGGTA